MADTTDLTARLARLNRTVETTLAERNRKAEVTKAALLDRKRRDWEACCEQAPDHARLIGELHKGFGKLASVRVAVNRQVILDSSRYCNE